MANAKPPMAPHVARAVEAARSVAQPKTLGLSVQPTLAPHVARVVQAVQRSAGARSSNLVQLRKISPSPLAQLRIPPVIQRANTSEVISGHGRFNENYLETVGRREKRATFPVPAGVTVTLYAPDGAALDNRVANLIEQGTPPAAGAVEMKQNDGSKVQPVPTPYPYEYTDQGKEVVNYTVMPTDKLNVMGKPFTVKKPTSLKEIVETLAAQGITDIHYACCGAGYSDKFGELFPYRGWHVRLK